MAAAPDLRRPGRGLEGLGHRRERVRRLPQRIRRDGDGPRAPEDRGSRARAGGQGHALRAAHRGRPAGRRAARRANRSSVLAVRELGHRSDARCGAHHAGVDRTRPDPEDRRHVSRAPRCADGERLPARGQSGAARAPELGAADARADPRHGRIGGERAVQRPRPRTAGLRRARGRVRGHDHRAGHDELRGRAARRRLPAGSEGAVPRRWRDVRLRRGEDRLHGGMGWRDRGVRRATGPRRVREGARRRSAVRRDRWHRGGDGRRDQRRHRPGRHVQRQPAHDGGGQA